MRHPLQLLGHGIDLVSTARLGDLAQRHGDRFYERVFTAAERAYCEKSVKRRMEHLAGRFAAKEAVLKALGTGLTGGIAWTEVEVVRAPSGQPGVRLTGRAAQIAAERGVTTWWLSISHIESHAVASAIAVGE